MLHAFDPSSSEAYISTQLYIYYDFFEVCYIYIVCSSIIFLADYEPSHVYRGQC